MERSSNGSVRLMDLSINESPCFGCAVRSGISYGGCYGLPPPSQFIERYLEENIGTHFFANCIAFLNPCPAEPGLFRF